MALLNFQNNASFTNICYGYTSSESVTIEQINAGIKKRVIRKTDYYVTMPIIQNASGSVRLFVAEKIAETIKQSALIINNVSPSFEGAAIIPGAIFPIIQDLPGYRIYISRPFNINQLDGLKYASVFFNTVAHFDMNEHPEPGNEIECQNMVTFENNQPGQSNLWQIGLLLPEPAAENTIFVIGFEANRTDESGSFSTTLNLEFGTGESTKSISINDGLVNTPSENYTITKQWIDSVTPSAQYIIPDCLKP